MAICICHSRGETEDAINHYETAIGVASPSNWHDEQFWVHHSLAELNPGQGNLANAQAYAKRANSHATHSPYLLGRAMHLQAQLWCNQWRLKDAKSEVLRAAEIFEKLGAARELEVCKIVLTEIGCKIALFDSDESDSNGESPAMVPLPTGIEILTLHSKLREPNDNSDGCLYPLDVSSHKTLPSRPAHPRPFLTSSACARSFVYFAPLLAVDMCPVLSISLSPTPRLSRIYVSLALAVTFDGIVL